MSGPPESDNPQDYLDWADEVEARYKERFGEHIPLANYGFSEQALLEGEESLEKGEPLDPPEIPKGADA